MGFSMVKVGDVALRASTPALGLVGREEGLLPSPTAVALRGPPGDDGAPRLGRPAPVDRLLGLSAASPAAPDASALSAPNTATERRWAIDCRFGAEVATGWTGELENPMPNFPRCIEFIEPRFMWERSTDSIRDPPTMKGRDVSDCLSAIDFLSPPALAALLIWFLSCSWESDPSSMVSNWDERRPSTSSEKVAATFSEGERNAGLSEINMEAPSCLTQPTDMRSSTLSSSWG